MKRRLLWMVLIALAFRIAILTGGHTYRVSPREQLFGFGWEAGRIAKSLAEGSCFCSPFDQPTGPTAWVAPVYPLLLTLDFKLFGVYTPMSAGAVLAFNSLASALVCWPLYLLARRLFDEGVARWSAWIWALSPYAAYWAVRWIWETSLSALLLTTAMLLAVKIAWPDRDAQISASAARGKGADWKLWTAFGGLWGVIGLTNTSLLSFLPFCAVWLAWQCARQRRAWIVRGLAAAAICIAILAPWTIRNYLIFHKLIPVRGNFWVEFRLGNGPGARGLWMSELHPSTSPIEEHKYAEKGEVAYVQSRKQEALAWVKEDPLRFLATSAKKFVYFWWNTPREGRTVFETYGRHFTYFAWTVLAFWGVGLAIKRRAPAAWLLAFVFLSVPTVYYFTFPHPRYRHPIEPVMLMVSVYLVLAAKRAGGERRLLKGTASQ